jgi:hypothetical protein
VRSQPAKPAGERVRLLFRSEYLMRPSAICPNPELGNGKNGKVFCA